MKKFLMALMALHITLLTIAQSTATNPDSLTILYLTEYRYASKATLQKHYPESRSFWMKNVPEMTNRFSYTSESRRLYSFSMFKGEKNYGKFIGTRGALTEKYRAEHKASSDALRANGLSASTRSSWTVLRDQSTTEANWDPNKHNYRKLHMYTVAYTQMEAFEALLKEIKEYEAKTNRSFNRIIAKCIDGYSSNTYITMLPDDTNIDYLQHRESRSKNRDAKLTELFDKLYAMMTIVRTDDLYRLTF